ncbi:MAG: NAD-dependent epimerase/dehydratase family protein [bacterium]
MSAYWEKRKVLVTGGGGFIGSHLCELLVEAGAEVTSGDLGRGYIDESPLKDKITFLKINYFKDLECLEMIKGFDTVMHLAARVGGINYNMKHKADMYIDNTLIGCNVAKAIIENGIKNALMTSSACIYPHDAKTPINEADGLRGIPEETNEGYGWAKRGLEITGKMMKEQYGIHVAIVRPYNAYGPRDKFDIAQAHVIPALINKVFHATDGKIEVWGNGEQTRAFVYAKDIARGMMLATEKYKEADPVNIGSNEEVSIKDLVHIIIEASGLKVTPIFDSSKPTGHKKRYADMTKAKEMLGFTPEYSMKTGIEKTIEYYKAKYLK